MNLSLQEQDWTATVLHYSVASEQFGLRTDEPGLFDRDGVDQQVGFNQFFYLFHNKLILGTGYAYRWDQADGSLFSLSSNIANVSLQAALPCNFTFRAFGQFENDDYIDFTPEPQRLDGLYTGTVALSHSLFIDDLTAEIAFTHASANSSQEFADYRRNVLSISLNFNY